MDEKNQTDTLLQTDAVIKRYLRQIKELGNQIREKASQYKDSFSNDASYHEAEGEAKKVSQKLKQAKEKITQLPSNQKAAQEVKELRQDLKDAKEVLSTYLKKYVTETGLTTIEDDEGVVLKIVPTYKLEKATHIGSV